MSRSWRGLLLLALLAPACRSAGPKVPPAAPAPLPDLLRPYEGALRVLPSRGDERTLTIGAGQQLTGECDVAVRVRSVAFDEGTTRFALETLGLPKVAGRGVACKRLEPAIQLVLTGPAGAATPELTGRIDRVLPTPEAYLQAKGTAFDLPPGNAPPEVASTQSDANDGERRLARAVVAWPRLLLSVDATLPAPPGRARFERLVACEAIVGTDGRLHAPRTTTSLDPAENAVVLSALSFWRFEPARRADAPVGARIPLELVLRVY
jgi:hypothetical protein